MRAWRTTGHENGFRETDRRRRGQPLCYRHSVSDCLKVGIKLCDDTDPATETDPRR